MLDVSSPTDQFFLTFANFYELHFSNTCKPNNKFGSINSSSETGAVLMYIVYLTIAARISSSWTRAWRAYLHPPQSENELIMQQLLLTMQHNHMSHDVMTFEKLSNGQLSRFNILGVDEIALNR
jgi:hypothetical protein